MTTEVFGIWLQAAAIASGSAFGVTAKWKRMHWSTYKATLRRNGEYRDYNFNGDLVDPFIRLVDANWARLFNHIIPRRITDALESCESAVEAFKHGFVGTVVMKCLSHVQQKDLDRHLSAFVQSLYFDLQKGTQIIEEARRQANRLPGKIVQTRMTLVYLSAAKHSGRGCFGRMKQDVSSHLTLNMVAIFREICEQVETMLRDTLRDVQKFIMANVRAKLNALKKDLNLMVSQMRSDFNDLDPDVRDNLIRLLEQAKTLFTTGKSAEDGIKEEVDEDMFEGISDSD